MLAEFLEARGRFYERSLPASAVAALEGVFRRARAEEPSIDLEPMHFIRYLGKRCAGVDDLVEHLSTLRAGDLWLACGCASGNSRALLRFQTRFSPDIETAVLRSGNANISIEDFRQHLMGKLFTAPPDGSPRITEYNGHGSLQGWFRITIVRQVIDFVRRNQRRDLGHQVEETELLELQAVAADPELAYLRNSYQDELREALHEGFAALTPRERNLMRQLLVYGMGVDNVALIYRVHRSTAHRWRVRAQEKLLEVTRESLRRRLKIDTGDPKAMAELPSNLHITVRRYLSRETEDES